MSLLRRIRSLGQRDQLDREIRSELEEHIQMAIDDSVARGMDPAQAAREVRLRFGNPTVVEERVGAEDAALGLDSVLRDLRYALRGFAKNPAFTAVAILTLALGIGANTAVFQLIDALRLRSLPIQKPTELVELRIAQGNRGFGITDGAYDNFTIPMWQEIRRHHDPLSGIFAWRTSDDLFGPLSDAKHIRGIEVSGEYFGVLGVTPWLGRLIQPEDETSDCQVHQVVVSYPFWKSQLAAQAITSQTTASRWQIRSGGRCLSARILRRGCRHRL